MILAYTLPLADTWGMHGDVGTGWMIGMMAIMVVFWGAVILGLAWLIRGAVETRRSEPAQDAGERRETPTEVLQRRFAEGTISLDDYQARRAVLANGDARTDEAAIAPRA